MRQKSDNDSDFTKWPFVLSRQQRLLQKALAPWPRRAAPLLDVNCGNGFFLPLIWQSGFDAIATEYEPKLRQLACRQPVPGLEIRAAREDDLPFEDDSFDWVILHVRHAEKADSGAREALRVARRGLMILFWNSASLPFWLRRPRQKDLPCGSICFWKMWRRMRALGVARQTGLSLLGGPVFTWRESAFLSRINDWPAGPLGAWCVIRLDMASGIPATPLALRLEEAFNPPRAVMEYTQKKTALNLKNEKKS